MRKCRKMISLIMLMAILTALTPYRAFAADATAGVTSTEAAAVEEPPKPAAEEKETESGMIEEIIAEEETEVTENSSKGASSADSEEKDEADTDSIKTSVNVEIIWADDDDRDGVRPESVTVQLTADDGPVKENPKTAVLNKENNWKYTWEDLDKKAAGKDIIYSVDEEKLPEGYHLREVTPNEDNTSFTILNQRWNESISGSIAVVWDDNDNIDQVRPDSVNVILKADGEMVLEYDFNDNSWKAAWENFSRYKNHGEEIEYTLEVEPIDGYTTEISLEKEVDNSEKLKYVYTVTNTHKERPVSILMFDSRLRTYVEGAVLQLLYKDGNSVIEEWVTNGDGVPHIVYGLTPGVTYTLHEKSHPNSYITVDDLTFSVSSDGTIITGGTVSEENILLIDGSAPVLSVGISVADIRGDRELNGAIYQILDADGNIVSTEDGNGNAIEQLEWVSTGSQHLIFGLKVGVKYILREISEPEGYTVKTDTAFMLETTGSITTYETVIHSDKPENDEDPKEPDPVITPAVPAAPSSFKATAAANGKGFKLTWKKVTNATSYVIYRNNKKIKTVGNIATYTDTAANTNGKKYIYKIYAKNAAGTSSQFKSVVTYKVTRATIKSLKNSKSKKMTVKWAKNTKATGYQLQYCTKSTFKGKKTITMPKSTKVSKTISKLTKGKTYYVRLRTYKKVGGKTYFSAWSNTRKVKIKK